MTTSPPVNGSPEAGCLYGVGTGPGDPELLTLKAARLIAQSPVVAYFCRRGGRGQARAIVDAHLGTGQCEMPLEYPVTNEIPHGSEEYRRRIEQFFDACAEQLAAELEAGRSVVVLNEGDPFFYGSFMHVYLRLKDRFSTHVVPGVTSMMASAAQLSTPLTMRDDLLTVIPGTMPIDDLRQALQGTDAAVIMKVGTHRDAVVGVLQELGLSERAWYVERASTAEERVQPLSEIPERVPYFSMIVIPGRGVRR
ncbi:precorrin-2 C(20)-methyltransferase [Thioalkalivibrio sp. HL-Eb18]|uniref:precorrin-2 C(20)-methyltransferase n=1 Tax=Thioalkalivibrio sp. HL-Eb18 TaxID=1266913 RepID=UPI00056F65D4|nr:precorrin-2 C(20)-methyltransferase [Thioalkalivibrio sp. HL-Eb18]